MSLDPGEKETSCQPAEIMDTTATSVQKIDASDGCQYRYVSEVDHIRMLRDVYKQQTQRTFDEFKAQVEEQRNERMATAEKAVLLLEHSKAALQHLDEQRHHVGDVLAETVKQAKAHSQQLQQRAQQDQAKVTTITASIRQLLSDLKR